MTFERLSSTPKEKVWGSVATAPWFENSAGAAIGELWFEDSGATELLVKFLFTSDKLSVQVHPNDVQAQAAGLPRGKTEMWHVVHAEPEAAVALGLKRRASEAELRRACESGEVVEWLNWIAARTGDTFFVPAGTIHAIGAGLVLCEVQQNSDTTYRLHDYGRRPELHLEEGIPVSRLEPWEPRKACSGPIIAECEYFRTERFDITGSLDLPAAPGNKLFVALQGEGVIAGQPFRAGEGFEAGAGFGPVRIESANAVILAAAKP